MTICVVLQLECLKGLFYKFLKCFHTISSLQRRDCHERLRSSYIFLQIIELTPHLQNC